MTRRTSPLAQVLIAPIRFYQRFITPYTPATCRYYPTCSSYAVTALREHGAVRGSWLTLRRLGRCHPWSAGGIDYVPARRERIRVSGSSVSVSSPPSSSAAAPWDVCGCEPADPQRRGGPSSPLIESVRHPADALTTDRSTAA